MTKDEALRLAWGALEDIGDEWGFTSQRTVPKRKEAITAIKAALEAKDEPVALKMDVIVVNLVREGINKHRARELAEHFIKHTTTPPQQEAKDEKQEPVAWLLTDKNINSLQVDSIQRLIDRLKHAHHTDLCVRINGQDEWFQADWLKHMVRATPPQRTWVNATTWRGLTDDEILSISADCASSHQHMDIHFARAIEAKLKAKNSL